MAFKRWVRTPWILASFQLAVLFVPFAPVEAQAQRSFLWKVESKMSTVYILGSVHFLKKENYPLTARIEEAFQRSSALVVEANINDLGKLDPQRLLSGAFYGDDDSMDRHLSPEVVQLVKKETGDLGIPIELVNRQKPWFLAITLEALELMKSGYDPQYGIDLHFLNKARPEKRILELESLDDQLRLLSNLSDRDQELFLLLTLTDLRNLGEQADRMVKAWADGEPERLESIITKSVREEPRLRPVFEKLIDERNRKMVVKIEEYLKTGESYFVVVGAGHLVGNKGIIEILKNKGYTVEQL